MPPVLARTLLLVCGLLLAIAAQAQGAAAPQSAAAPEDAALRKVVMYATDWCPYCARARAHFRKHGIDYVEFDIEKSASARAQHQRLGGRGVPLILVGERRMNGFSEARFDAVYAISRH